MPKPKLPNIKKLLFSLKKLPLTLGKNAFLTFLSLFLLSLLFGFLVFYQHNSSVDKAEFEIKENQFEFKDTVYQKILETWEERNKLFEQARTKAYPNLFIH